MSHYYSNNIKETAEIGREIAENLKAGDVVAFYGELGAGKTCLAGGIASGLGFSGDTFSPTFSLINEYNGGRLPIAHFDMYRVSGWDDLYSTGFFDYIDRGFVLLVEWSENIEAALPDNTIKILLSYDGESCRKITVLKEGEQLENFND